MKSRFFLHLSIMLIVAITSNAYSQIIKSPSDFLGYPLGTEFTYHHKVMDYFDYVDTMSEQVMLYEYGQTYERRELKVAYISAPENLKNLEEIKKNNLRRARFVNEDVRDSDIAIVWLSYNVHGNEANSTETAMKVLHELVSDLNDKYSDWLEKMVIILDPCLNPDGRDRYVNWYNQVANISPNPNVFTREHQEDWAQGRSNHYLFDLNRDWVWQSQVESVQRLKLYNEWLPQVHVDFHEQYYNSQYYFAPAAQPMHELITPWQNEFQQIVGKNNAHYFDEKGWLYFSNEVFDLLYPAYGDTYPMFNGAIGMTYEMPGHSLSGLAVETKKGDTLTLGHRIDMHFTSSIATLEASYAHRQSLLKEFTKFYNTDLGKDTYYILKSPNADKKTLLRELLDKNKIIYHSSTTSKPVKAFSYEKNESLSINVDKEDLVIPQNQPKATLVKVLFERNTKLSDSLTYDITAWSLPFMYGLDAYSTQEKIELSDYDNTAKSSANSEKSPYAYLLNWTSIKDAEFLSTILNKGIKVSYSTKKFALNNQNYSEGTLIITRIDNEKTNSQFEKELLDISNKLNRELVPVYSGASITTIDLGSEKIKYLKRPKIAMLAGEGISTLKFGELWYFFEQEINFPIDIIKKSDFNSLDLRNYNHLLLPSGQYAQLTNDDGFQQIDTWIKGGGTLTLFEDAVTGFIGDEKFALKENKVDKKDEKEEEPRLYPYKEYERENLKKYIPGGIIKLKIDNTHPLAFGYDTNYYTLKTNADSYKYLEKGWNVGYSIDQDNIIAGYVGADSKEKIIKNLVFGVEHRGKGKVIYFIDDPVFRAFWQNGKLFLANAVFFN